MEKMRNRQILGEFILDALEKTKLKFPDAQFIVFGSRARGDNSDDSDLDVYVVFPELREDPYEIIYSIRKELHEHLKLALDVIVCDQPIFDARKTNKTTLEYYVQSEGIAV